MSATAYNKRFDLALVCPATSRAKAYPFEVALPEGLPIPGTVLTDHFRSRDWRPRRSIARCDQATRTDVLQRARALLTQEDT
ncbi:MAG TPA: type II toxin-antitoxin system PemK/MazF family toxin [Verrucomicrobiae bacterium]|nr:type II toxin-antitoxin system PemK/MazF family toxin [Verrucomicrobiae bacterium]